MIQYERGVSFMKKLLIGLLVIFLFSCKNNTPELLDIPENLSFNQTTYTLTWNEVNGASSYVVYLDDSEYEVSTNAFVVPLSSGDYEVKVKAINNKTASAYSSPISIEVIKLETFNYTVSENISFDVVPGASSYKMYAYSSTNTLIKEESVTTQINLDEYIGVVRFELEAYFKTHKIANTSFKINFDLITYTKDTDDLEIQLYQTISSFHVNKINLTASQYALEENKVYIKNTYLDSLSDGIYVLSMTGTSTYYYYMMITSYERPSLLSASVATYSNQDITFTFDLKGGTFDGLTGTPSINQNDYTFINQTLTISQSYMTQVLNQHPNLDSIVLVYLISNGPYSIYGYLTINIRST